MRRREFTCQLSEAYGWRQLEARLADWARITLESNIPADRLYLAAYAAFKSSNHLL